MTTSGQLRDRITFAALVETANDMGGRTQDYADRFTVWARRQYLRGGEAVRAARLEGRQPVILTVRASADTRSITTDWRAHDTRTGDVYQIRSVEPAEDRAFIDMLCERGAI